MLMCEANSRGKRCFQLAIAGVLAAAMTVSAPDFAAAAGGSWGGSGGFGSGGSGGSVGGSGGSWGGSGGGLFGGRRPIRNLLGRIGSRLSSAGSGGSMGGSGGGSLGSARGSNGGSWGGSTGGSAGGYAGTTGGSWGGSAGGYAASSSAAAYGSWGADYLGSLNASPSYVSTAAPVFSQPMVDTSSFMTPAIAGCADCGITSNVGVPVQQGITETGYSMDSGYSADTGFYDGSMPNYDSGVPMDGMPVDSSGEIYDSNLSAPTDYYDSGSSLLDDSTEPPMPGPADGDSTMRKPSKRGADQAADRDAAILSLFVPADAKVYINGRLTKTKGETRNYVSRRLKSDREYSYRVKTVIERDGQRLVRTKVVKMKPGVTQTVQVDFNQPVTTMLALSVPADAKVRLCGAETNATGQRRFFETARLTDGQTWDNYEIEVTVDRDGQEVVERKSLTLRAGETHTVAFEFDDQAGKLAAK